MRTWAGRARGSKDVDWVRVLVWVLALALCIATYLVLAAAWESMT